MNSAPDPGFNFSLYGGGGGGGGFYGRGGTLTMNVCVQSQGRIQCLLQARYKTLGVGGGCTLQAHYEKCVGGGGGCLPYQYIFVCVRDTVSDSA